MGKGRPSSLPEGVVVTEVMAETDRSSLEEKPVQG
jgi:hypothetical protein